MGQKAQDDDGYSLCWILSPYHSAFMHALAAGHQNFQSRSVVVELCVIHIIYVNYGSNTDLGDQYAGTQSLKGTK